MVAAGLAMSEAAPGEMSETDGPAATGRWVWALRVDVILLQSGQWEHGESSPEVKDQALSFMGHRPIEVLLCIERGRVWLARE